MIKKVLSRVMLYSELELSENQLFTNVLKNLPYGKETKKPAYKKEKTLVNNL